MQLKSGERRRSNAKYPPEIKDAVMQEYVNGIGTSPSDLADKYGVPVGAVNNWVRKYGLKDKRAEADAKRDKMIQDKVIAGQARRISSVIDLESVLISKINEAARQVDPGDTAGIRNLAQAIHNLPTAGLVRSKRDEDEQQAKIDKLKKDLEADKDGAADIKVTFEGLDPKWQN